MSDSVTWKAGIRRPGVLAALGAALLFGAGTPLAKALLGNISPWLLAGLLYLGSGIGLTVYCRLKRAPAPRLPLDEKLWLTAAIVAGGMIAPVLLMMGLSHMPASGASLLLNAESVLTTLLAWFVFREPVDRRVALGMVFIVAGALLLSWPTEIRFAGVWPALAVLGACMAWAIDNNLTRKVSLTDAAWIASVKGLVAGCFNLLMAGLVGASMPSPPHLVAALLLGLFAYGVSLALFVVGLRHLGAARTGAYFSIAPFVGALLAVGLGESITAPLLGAAVLMAIGIWLHLTEYHAHEHCHDTLEHEHEHCHDAHHQHAHDHPIAPDIIHSHHHRHQALTHHHAHQPDVHHQHSH